MTASPFNLAEITRAESARRLTYRRGIEIEHLEELECRVSRDNVVHWISHWCYTADPRDLAIYPFVPWPRQVDFLKWLQVRKTFKEPGVCEKSRDSGASWLCAADAVHDWLFKPYFVAGFGSRKLEYVDRLGDLKSLLEKCRFLIRSLPGWMVPRGWIEKQHSNHCRILNPANGSAITGEGGDDIGRGDRTTVYFVDEAAKLIHPEMVDGALAATTDCRIDVSTANGPNMFYRRRMSLPPEQVFTFHWKTDPRKTEAWAAKKRTEIGPVVWASEYEIDYTASVGGLLIPANWVRAAIQLADYEPELFAPWRGEEAKHLQRIAGFDVGEEGEDLCVVIDGVGPVVEEEGIAHWGHSNTTQSAYNARNRLVERGVHECRYDVTGVGAGIKGTWNTLQADDTDRAEQAMMEASDAGKTPEEITQAGERALKKLPFKIVPVAFGEQCSEDTVWPDGQTSKEKFLNVRAEMGWMLRCRFEKTWEFVEKGIDHPIEELISIPNHPALITEMSVFKVESTETGKIKLESKKALKARGVKSPDFFDALMLRMWKNNKRKLKVW